MAPNTMRSMRPGRPILRPGPQPTGRGGSWPEAQREALLTPPELQQVDGEAHPPPSPSHSDRAWAADWSRSSLSSEPVGTGGMVPRLRPPRLRTAAQVPAYFICPISGDIMRDPVTLEEGYSYERADLVAALAQQRISPKTGQDLGSVKFFPNLLLKRAIERRADWVARHGPDAATDSYYCIIPPRGTMPYTHPVLLSDGITYDRQQLAWTDGRRFSPITHARLRDRELLIPNRAVAAMVVDAGYAGPSINRYVEKYAMWSSPHRCVASDTCGTCVAGGLFGALIGASMLALLTTCNVGIPAAAWPVVSGSGAAGGGLGSAMAGQAYNDRRRHSENDRRNGRPRFDGP